MREKEQAHQRPDRHGCFLTLGHKTHLAMNEPKTRFAQLKHWFEDHPLGVTILVVLAVIGAVSLILTTANDISAFNSAF